MKESADVIVVGAGPAGAAAAISLARAGIDVVLADRAHFPRDKSCGDGLTPYAVRLLDELGVGTALAGAQRVDGVAIAMRGGRTRRFPYSSLSGTHNYGLVLPRRILDLAILKTAISAGARFEANLDCRGLISRGGRVVGARFRSGEGFRDIEAKVVIGANGAASRLRRDAFGADLSAASPGFGLRGYFRAPRADPAMLSIAMPLADPTNSYVLPSYGWVFPVGEGVVNLGVGLFEGSAYGGIGDLYQRFAAQMTEQGGLAPGGEALGPPLGAPLRFDFSAGTATAPGLLLAGDAAGLVSPFTGEGISYALESGRLAGEVAARCIHAGSDPAIMEDDYRFLLEHKFTGYFEIGQKSGRRYQLIWHVIESSFDSERPVFSVLRRLALVPEGAGSMAHQDIGRDLAPCLPPGSFALKSQLHKVGVRLVSALRKDWPFLSRLEQSGRSPGAVVFRPSLLFLAAASLGSAPEERLINAATGLDLCYLAMFAQTGIEEEQVIGERVNWGNKFSILLGDLLFARAFEFCAVLGTEAMHCFIRAFEDANEGHLKQLDNRANLSLSRRTWREMQKQKFAPLFVLPCILGARLAGRDEFVPVLSRYASSLSLAFTVMEDVAALREVGGGAVSAMATDHAAGFLSLPVLEALAAHGAAAHRIQALYGEKILDLAALSAALAESKGISKAAATARQQANASAREAALLPPSPAASLLFNIAKAVGRSGI